MLKKSILIVCSIVIITSGAVRAGIPGMTIAPPDSDWRAAVTPPATGVALPRAGELTVTVPDLGLCEDAMAAIALAPEWLVDDLADNFSRLEEAEQQEIAQYILNPADERYRDEYAFLAAHMAPEMLSHRYFDGFILEENVRWIYDMADALAYVELLDVDNGGGDYYTTARYRMLDGGVPEWVEVPREIYYWYVVQPKVSDEKVMYTNPEDGSYAAAPVGVFWRPYLLFDSNLTYSYSEHYLELHPNAIPEVSLDSWGPSAKGYLTGFSVAPTTIVQVASSGEVVLGDIKSANQANTILATTMRVEAAYAADDCQMLANMVAYGNGHQGLGSNAPIALFKDNDQPEGDIVEQVLLTQGRPYTVFSSADVGVADISGFNKMIFPSYQPRAMYQAIADNQEWVETWLTLGNRILQIHLATNAADDPAGIVFPGGFTCSSQAETAYDDLEFGGYPILSDVLHYAEYYWDGESVNLDSGRLFAPGQTALDVAGNWVSKILKYKARGDRPIEPAAIARGHDGNCGELQDLLAAAGRCMLMPVQCVCNTSWDHVWDEFWSDGWHAYQVSWNGGPTHIDNPGVGADGRFGGGKELGAVYDWRNDEWKDTATDRYSHTCTLLVTVTDSNGNPVDGAKVTILVHYFGDPGQPLVTTAIKYTGIDGTVRFTLGDLRSFWGSVESAAGDYALADPEGIITDSVADSEYTWDVTVPGTVPVLPATPAAACAAPAAERLVISYETTAHAVHPMVIQFQHTFSYVRADGWVNMFICDEDNYALYKAGETFTTHYLEAASESGGVTFAPPHEDTWHVVLDTTGMLFARQSADLRVRFERESGSDWEVVDEVDSHGVLPAGAEMHVAVALAGPSCDTLGVTMVMPAVHFQTGAECYLRARICNDTGAVISGHPLFVILDVYGDYWFAPSWRHVSEGIDGYAGEYAPGLTELEIIEPFFWPAGTGAADDIRFWGVMTDAAVTDLYGELGCWTFGWSE
ncbi:Ig-like domain-containing protein [bacterium]|nr:Ig-like domain-containing protein [candidate division CSSED10-310 bacterium]